jgi:hypothetical protein
MLGIALSTGLPSAPWQPAQTWAFSSMLCASSGVVQTFNKAAKATMREMRHFGQPLIFAPVTNGYK